MGRDLVLHDKSPFGVYLQRPHVENEKRDPIMNRLLPALKDGRYPDDKRPGTGGQEVVETLKARQQAATQFADPKVGEVEARRGEARRGEARHATHAPYTIHHAPYTPRTVHHAPRTTHHAPRTTHHAPPTTHHPPRPPFRSNRAFRRHGRNRS